MSIAGVLEGIRGLDKARGLPGSDAPFVPPFGVFRWADLVGARPPETSVPCWHTVATEYPLGNCDSRRFETRLRYLTRLGAVPKLLAAQLLLRVTDGARPPPEELVNSASPAGELLHEPSRDRTNQPGPIFPQLPGIILSRRPFLAAGVGRLDALSFFLKLQDLLHHLQLCLF